ncbi:hypothetical protein N7486_005473 [Penicillium sp. IBT 16267x]|nr:hypothetical protein N7486_005473 [Penicillium sp. IBT 16267x]
MPPPLLHCLIKLLHQPVSIYSEDPRPVLFGIDPAGRAYDICSSSNVGGTTQQANISLTELGCGCMDLLSAQCENKE